MKLVSHKNKQRKGFTFIELSLFIAISGAILVGIMISTRTVISNQEDNDSVQNFANFLRNLYALTINPQYGDGEGDGDTDEAVYGCVAVFGAENNSTVHTYIITGPANFTNTGAKSYEKIYSDDITDGFKLTEYSTYHTSWDAQIKKAKVIDEDYRGSIIIMHNPTGSGINVYKTDSVEIDNIMSDKYFLMSDEIFCVKSSSNSSFIRGVQISAGGQNAGAVSVLDKGDGSCHE